ncbi:MAG: glycosyltransferase, partial [Ilumatobacter sp.]
MIDTTTSGFRVAIVGPSRFGIGEPYAGGLEAHTAGLVGILHERGHHLRVFAGPEGDIHGLPVGVTPIVARTFDHLFTGRRDTSHPAGFCRHESDRYRTLVDGLRRCPDIDVVHNNSLHPAVVDGDPGDGSFVHVLHCPPFPKLRAAHRRLRERSRGRHVIAVSKALASLWDGVATDVIGNGIDLDTWLDRSPGPRAGAVWAGRIVEEKAPHLAIRAARLAGLPIRLAGPIGDHRYFDRLVRPELGADAVWLGSLGAADL